MRYGTIHSFESLPGEPNGHVGVYRHGLDQIVRSEQLGFTYVNITEHHATDDGYCPALMPVLAAVAMRTTTLRLSTGMLILPLHNPVRIAEEAAVVDVLSGGRLTLGVAAGYRELEFEVMESDYRRRGRRFRESLEVLLAAWSGEPFSYDGETISLPEIVVRPTPLQRPHPPLWLGGGSDPALRRAVAYGAPLFPGATTPLPAVRELWERYRGFAADAGREPAGFVLPRLAYVGESVESARAVALPAIAAMFDRYVTYGNPPEVREALDDWALLDEYVLVGDAETVAARVGELEALGVTDLLLQFAIPSLDPAQAMASMERFAAAVELTPA
ncbi:LLM class flavin-dependent oxidoreductase [Conexibacter arvalis]|uniref:Putative F420-dependent oxidoreductase n=1 Tax=Conexibacter arvalis TaxID=912552 RepID=A0A840IEF4_9ACTN|nr:LLM class flavin-dependent oxidoreductase [Conexibacter arvalis]MBB4663192.1 putative F420-dependent oxidoreductase [Conexibacter arvalis]